MKKNESFFDYDQSKMFAHLPKPNTLRSPIIKKDKVVFGKSRKIEHSVQVTDIHQNGEISPVYNNGELIGVIYECSCGKIAQILFDFEEAAVDRKRSATG